MALKSIGLQNRAVALSHIRLPQLQPQYQRICSYTHLENQGRLCSFFDGAIGRGWYKIALLFVLMGLSFHLKLEKQLEW